MTFHVGEGPRCCDRAMQQRLTAMVYDCLACGRFLTAERWMNSHIVEPHEPTLRYGPDDGTGWLRRLLAEP